MAERKTTTTRKAPAKRTQKQPEWQRPEPEKAQKAPTGRRWPHVSEKKA